MEDENQQLFIRVYLRHLTGGIVLRIKDVV